MKTEPTIVPAWRNSRQIAGYRAQLRGAVARDRTGSEIAIDLTTAEALIEICDQLMHLERNAENRP